MHRIIRPGLLVLLVSIFGQISPTLFADNNLPSKSVMVIDSWSRPAPPVAANGAAYISLHNMGSTRDRLIGARSEIAQEVQIHDHVMSNGLMKMRHLDKGVSIDAGEMVQFKPGGKHLMLIGLNTPLVEGQSFELILQFENAGEKSVTIEIRDKTAGKDHSSHSMEQGG